MADTPWLGDSASLVEAFRRGERSPLEELRATYDAISRSKLNAFCFLDRESAERDAKNADISLPFGGVPFGVKELDLVAGWPDTEACMVFQDRIATTTDTQVDRVCQIGGAVKVGLTNASEFGGVNLTRTVLHGATLNPWQHDRTPGGSSGGSAAAVAGGLVTIATGGDGGGSIRIPAGFTGLVGLKATYGRIPRGPGASNGNLTSVIGCMARSVRDTARWFDVTNGHEAHDPLSLPRVSGWENGLGTITTQGMRVVVVPNFGGGVVSPAMWEVVEHAAEHLISIAGLRRRNEIDLSLPRLGAAWSITGTAAIAYQLRDHWPACTDQLTPEIRFGLERTANLYGTETRGKFEARRVDLNHRMAQIFNEVDLIITASNPDVAFNAQGPLPDKFGGIVGGAGNNGVLTFPANIYGNPGISIPVGNLDGLPVGMQVMSRHFEEPLLLDLALAVERSQPWALIAPNSPC
ncbi:MAG: amidase [Acidimicrobiaceae bacterium]|nr:amidase [Acidimicrobiaceae bacterium]